MAYIHQFNILHRDLKSSNVMITNDGQVKIIDFGISKFLDYEKAEKSYWDKQAKVGLNMTLEAGTLRWMAPEAINAVNDVPSEEYEISQYFDVFSYGCVLYEYATGKIPYPEQWPPEKILQAIKNHLTPDLVFFLNQNNCDPFIKDIIKQCWALKPQDRPIFANIWETLEINKKELYDIKKSRRSILKTC